MSNNIGTATIDFGAWPGSSEAEVVVTGQSQLLSTHHVEAFFQADTTVDHTADDHTYATALVGLTCGAIMEGVGFTIYARCLDKMQGTFQVRWVWA